MVGFGSYNKGNTNTGGATWCTACDKTGWTGDITWSLNCGKTDGTSYLVCGKSENLTIICGK